MNTKTIWYIVGGIVVIAIIVGAAYYMGTGYQSPVVSNNTVSPAVVPSPETTPPPSVTPPPTPESSVSQKVTVTYASGAFSPNPVTIKAGDTVTFKNNSSGNIRVASNPHPTHTGYPMTGGCVGSTFDSCSSIAPGASWNFVFDIKGSWGYHNHMSPGERGMVIVK